MHAEHSAGGWACNCFLEDQSFDYLTLVGKVDELFKRATQLIQSGQHEEALAAMREITPLRAVEEIPTPRWLAMYSFLLGRTGDTAGQEQKYYFDITRIWKRYKF